MSKMVVRTLFARCLLAATCTVLVTAQPAWALFAFRVDSVTVPAPAVPTMHSVPVFLDVPSVADGGSDISISSYTLPFDIGLLPGFSFDPPAASEPTPNNGFDGGLIIDTLGGTADLGVIDDVATSPFEITLNAGTSTHLFDINFLVDPSAAGKTQPIDINDLSVFYDVGPTSLLSMSSVANGSLSVAAVPEPAAWMLLGLVSGGLGLRNLIRRWRVVR